MIEQDVRNYLCTVSGVISAFATISGSVGRRVVTSGIWVIQATTGTSMPYMVVENSEGPREIIAANLTEETANVRITLDASPYQLYAGAMIIGEAHKALENYRGTIGNSKDITCKCSSIRGWAGTGGTQRYQFTAVIKHTMARNKPVGSLG